MVTTHQSRRESRLLRRLTELRAWRNVYEAPIPHWTFTLPDGRTFELSLGDFWPEIALPVELDASGLIPVEWAGWPVEVELWLGGEGLVRLSTGFQGGLNPMHHRFPVLDVAGGGESIGIHAEVVPKGIFGTNFQEPRLERATLVVPNVDVRALERDLAMLGDACAVLDQHEVVPFLLQAAEDALALLAPVWPTSTEDTVTRYVLGYDNGIGGGTGAVPASWKSDAIDNSRLTDPTWSLPDPPGEFGPLSEAAMAAVRAARLSLVESLEHIKLDYPPIGRLCLTGHAHIDLAWLWPIAETRRKIRRTFSTVLNLMERYDDFTFNQSSAQAYAWIEQDDPAVFEQIRKRVGEGRWEPVGGMWVEPDANIPSGEAFARQLFYGQRYFESRFGKRNTVAWLPDVFGYSGGLPQLMQGVGITGFFTTKLNWNEANSFPYDLFEWEGIDGSSVTSHTFFNPGQGYNGNIVPHDTRGTWHRYRGKTKHPESLFAFGWGDGAGGPSEKMLENYARIQDFPALPRLRMGNAQEFFATLPETGLPKVVGELYLELHRGTLTTQAKVKELNRSGEHRLLEAEVFSSIASLDGFEYRGALLEETWKTLLLNQFHDILPGSSISEVYVDTHQQLGEVVRTATQIRDEALSRIPAKGEDDTPSLIVANAGLNPRPLTLLVPATHEEFETEGTTQPVEGGQLISIPGAMVPGLGSIELSNLTASGGVHTPFRAVEVSRSGDSIVLENDLLRVEIGADGTIQRAFDIEANRPVLTDRGNQIWAYVDKPYSWDAWDIDDAYSDNGEEIHTVEKIEIVEQGPIRVAVRVERIWRGSNITQTYQLWHDSKRLDIVTDIVWHERQVLLKAHFPFAVRSHQAAFETMYGAVYRPTHRNGPTDSARFEVCGHRFADLSEPGYGVALLNNAKYGHEALGSDLMLSLLRSPLYPDPLADEGAHHFTYSLLPHQGDWTESKVVDEALWLNSPLILSTSYDGARSSFVQASGLPLGMGALKRAEDGNGLILRLYEPHGSRGTATLAFGFPVKAVAEVNLMEDSLGVDGELHPKDVDAYSLEFGPFQIRSLRIVPV